MENNNKLFKIISIALLGLSALVSVYFFLTDFNDPEALATATGVFLTLCYVLMAIGVLAAVGFSILTMAKNPGNAKNALIGVVALIVICGLGFVLSGNEVHIDYEGVLLADGPTSQKSEAGLIATYVLLAGAIGAIVFAEVSKMLK